MMEPQNFKIVTILGGKRSEGTCPRRLLYHLFEAPVLGPWAHLGFEKKRPQSLNKRPTKA